MFMHFVTNQPTHTLTSFCSMNEHLNLFDIYYVPQTIECDQITIVHDFSGCCRWSVAAASQVFSRLDSELYRPKNGEKKVACNILGLFSMGFCSCKTSTKHIDLYR